MNEVPHAFVVPHVTTGRHEQCLAWRDRVKAYAALRGVDTRSIGIAALVDTGTSQQPFMCRRVEIVQTLLPSAVAFDADLDTPEDDFLTTFEIYSELDDVTVINGVRSALDAGTGESDMVEEGAGAGFDVFDVPLTTSAPELAVAARDDFRFEADWKRIVFCRGSVALAIASNTNDGAGVFECPRNRLEV